MSARFIVGDVFDVLATVPDNSVDLVMSSPPFLALRSYLPADHPDKAREIGSEATPADFLDTLLDVTEACARVLAPHGSLVLELGDTFAGSGGAGGDYAVDGLRDGQNPFDGAAARRRSSRDGWPDDKSLCLIPTLYAASLAYGYNMLRPERTTPRWRVRNLVVWARPNPPVGALGDKFRPATSYLTVACKSRTRYFDLDAVRTPHKSDPEKFIGNGYTKGAPQGVVGNESMPGNPAGAPPLDYWVIPTKPYSGSHYAAFPPELVVRPVKSMCPLRVCTECGEPSRRIVDTQRCLDGEPVDDASRLGDDWARRTQEGEPGNWRWSTERTDLGWTDCGHDNWRTGVVLDPFAGSGTTLAVATGHGRDAIGIDLDERNAQLAGERVGPLLLTVEHHNQQGAA